MTSPLGRLVLPAALAALLLGPARSLAQPAPGPTLTPGPAPVPAAAPVPAVPTGTAPAAAPSSAPPAAPPVSPASAPPATPPGAAPGAAPSAAPPYYPYPYPYPYPYNYPYPYPYPYYGPYYAPPQAYYPAQPPPPPVPKEPYSKRMTWAGIGMVSAGGLALLIGSIVAVEGSNRRFIYAPGGYLREKRADDGMKNGGIALAVIGGVVAAAGIPLWAYGAHKVPIKQPPADSTPTPTPTPEAVAVLRLGATSAALDVTFW